MNVWGKIWTYKPRLRNHKRIHICLQANLYFWFCFALKLNCCSTCLTPGWNVPVPGCRSHLSHIVTSQLSLLESDIQCLHNSTYNPKPILFSWLTMFRKSMFVYSLCYTEVYRCSEGLWSISLFSGAISPCLHVEGIQAEEILMGDKMHFLELAFDVAG